MKKRRTIIVLLALIAMALVLVKCLSREDSIRDKIVFQTPVETVVDSLEIMNNFISNMTLHLDKKSGYRIHKGKGYNDLYIGGKKIGNMDEIRNAIEKSRLNPDSIQIEVKTNDIFNSLTDISLTRFVNLAMFLDDNSIASSYYSQYFNAIVFGYRDTLIYDDEDVRNIILLETVVDTSQFINEVKVFDRKDKIVLFSPYK